MTKLATIDHLTQTFDGTDVLKGITTNINEGDVIGVLGLNGAGKSTLIETLLGFIPAQQGDIKLFGESPLNMSLESKSKIGYVAQEDELLPNLTGHQYLSLLSGYYADWNKEVCDKLINDWQVDANKRISKLSVGQRQKLSIIASMAYNPQLLVLDEPVASLDPVARREFLQTIAGIACEPTNAVVFSTHIVTDLERVASRLWMIKDGELIFDTYIDELADQVSVIEFDGAISLPKLPGELSRKHPLGNTRICVQGYNQSLAQHIDANASVKHQRIPVSLEDLMLEIHA